MRLIVSFFALVFFHLALKAQTGNQARNGVVINVKDFGAKGDGKDNDYKAIQKGIAELHRIGSGILYFPKGTYRINEVFRLDEKGKVLNGKSHFFFNGLTNVTIKGEKGTVISIKGDYHRKADWILAERKFGYSYDHQVSFVFSQCRNITIENIEINGNCNKMTRDLNVVENQSYGFLFGAGTADTVENVKMTNCYIHHMATDGVCWKGRGGGFYAENLKLTNNGRCALSIVQGKNMKFVNCDFSETGITGSFISHSPNTGVDIENESFSTIENIRFSRCRFQKNTSTQFVATGFDGIHAGRTVNVHMDSCYFEESRGTDVVGERTVMITTDNSSITNSTIVGTLNFDVNGCSQNGQPGNGVLIKNCNIKTKGHGIKLNCDFKIRIENCTVEQMPNLDEPSCTLHYPFINTGPNVVIENNTFIYNSSNWRQTHATIAWDLNNYLQGGKSVINNVFMLKEEKGKSMKPGAVYMIFTDKKFENKNRVVGTQKIIFTRY